jgi:hypothetical protein
MGYEDSALISAARSEPPEFRGRGLVYSKADQQLVLNSHHHFFYTPRWTSEEIVYFNDIYENWHHLIDDRPFFKPQYGERETVKQKKPYAVHRRCQVMFESYQNHMQITARPRRSSLHAAKSSQMPYTAKMKKHKIRMILKMKIKKCRKKINKIKMMI